MYRGERVTMVVPNGEQKRDVFNLIGNIGYTVAPKAKRDCRNDIVEIPLTLVECRAGSIPQFVRDERSWVVAGITGSDILWEAGLGKNSGFWIPTDFLDPEAVRSKLYIGMTNDFYDFAAIRLTGFTDPGVQTLNNNACRVATKYPGIAKEVFEERGMNRIEIFPVAGTDEAIQYMMPCQGILGIISTGTTAKANRITVLETILNVETRMIVEPGKMNNLGNAVIDDFKEKVQVAVQKKRLEIFQNATLRGGEKYE